MNKLSGKVVQNLDSSFKKQMEVLEMHISQKMEKRFSSSENKVNNLIYNSEELFQKNRKHANKRHWLLMGAFCSGCVILNLSLSFLFMHQNIARIDPETIPLTLEKRL